MQANATALERPMSTALTRVQPLPRPLATVTAFVDRMRQLQDQAFVLCPFSGTDSIRGGYQISERIVVVNPDVAAKEVYYSSTFCKAGEVALTKIAILRLWSAAGGSVAWSRRVDDMEDPRLCSWDVMLTLKQLDGNIQRFPGNRTVDYRDGSDQLQGMQPKQIQMARARITELVERAHRIYGDLSRSG